MAETTTHSDARTRLLDAALHLIRAQGYSATTVDGICRATGLTKGAFFYHFKSKDDLALAAAAHFSEIPERCSTASYRELTDALDRITGYVDFRSAILVEHVPAFTCLLGNMVQEAYDTHPPIRRACNAYIDAHAAEVAKDIAAVKALNAPEPGWSAEARALYGGGAARCVQAGESKGAATLRECLAHLRRYLEHLFHRPISKEEW
jgi:TetR/AcrR family transcriptional repressor of nem operon